jgi:hypothetical protein
MAEALPEDPQARDPVTRADLNRVRNFVRDHAEDVRLDVLDTIHRQRRELVRRVLVAAVVCAVAALVIWAWVRMAWDHVRHVNEGL